MKNDKLINLEKLFENSLLVKISSWPFCLYKSLQNNEHDNFNQHKYVLLLLEKFIILVVFKRPTYLFFYRMMTHSDMYYHIRIELSTFKHFEEVTFHDTTRSNRLKMDLKPNPKGKSRRLRPEGEAIMASTRGKVSMAYAEGEVL